MKVNQADGQVLQAAAANETSFILAPIYALPRTGLRLVYAVGNLAIGIFSSLQFVKAQIQGGEAASQEMREKQIKRIMRSMTAVFVHSFDLARGLILLVPVVGVVANKILNRAGFREIESAVINSIATNPLRSIAGFSVQEAEFQKATEGLSQWLSEKSLFAAAVEG